MKYSYVKVTTELYEVNETREAPIKLITSKTVGLSSEFMEEAAIAFIAMPTSKEDLKEIMDWHTTVHITEHE